jgi:diaminohydroxyphosphoribosylaminopyrimidine deaminase/5-amino-6-(5-phosphoribosylamino)uracil reductase
MAGEQDERFMRLALEVGRRGRPSPNPHVGAVVARDGQLLATGFHMRAGGAHAEVAALEKLPDGAEGATVYVTMEPCNHRGRTGPCSEALIEAGVARVVIGSVDPVAGHGGGADRLRRAGIEVQEGVCEDAALALTADWRTHALRGRPHVTLKAAVTLDGRMAAATGDSRWVTGELARTEAHRMRDRADGILVGVGTVLTDDPALTVRHVNGRDPVRVVLDTALRTPPRAKVLRAGDAPCWIFHGPDAAMASRAALRDAGAELFSVEAQGARLDLERVLEALATRHIVRLLVEGGPTVHGALLDADLADAAAIFLAPRILGDPAALPLAHGRSRARMLEAAQIEPRRVRELGEDILVEGPLKRSPA